MRIGELAKATGTSVETIRYYEREGILPAADRTDSNYRDYTAEHLATLGFIRRSRALGFGMAQVRRLLTLADNAEDSCEDVDLLVQDQMDEVDRKIADLIELRSELQGMLGTCARERIGDCRIISALKPQPSDA